jgi:hypothetical protein
MMFRFPRFRYRTARRLILLLFLCITVFCVGYLQDALYDALHSQKQPTPDHPTTVTHTVFIDPYEQPTSASSRSMNPPTTLPRHKYCPDGLLEVNADGVHPIFELIERSEAEWKAKLSRASKSLDEAVVEYQRRYKRPPPLGFDSWYVFTPLTSHCLSQIPGGFTRKTTKFYYRMNMIKSIEI